MGSFRAVLFSVALAVLLGMATAGDGSHLQCVWIPELHKCVHQTDDKIFINPETASEVLPSRRTCSYTEPIPVGSEVIQRENEENTMDDWVDVDPSASIAELSKMYSVIRGTKRKRSFSGVRKSYRRIFHVSHCPQVTANDLFPPFYKARLFHVRGEPKTSSDGRAEYTGSQVDTVELAVMLAESDHRASEPNCLTPAFSKTETEYVEDVAKLHEIGDPILTRQTPSGGEVRAEDRARIRVVKYTNCAKDPEFWIGPHSGGRYELRFMAMNMWQGQVCLPHPKDPVCPMNPLDLIQDIVGIHTTDALSKRTTPSSRLARKSIELVEVNKMTFPQLVERTPGDGILLSQISVAPATQRFTAVPLNSNQELQDPELKDTVVEPGAYISMRWKIEHYNPENPYQPIIHYMITVQSSYYDASVTEGTNERTMNVPVYYEYPGGILMTPDVTSLLTEVADLSNPDDMMVSGTFMPTSHVCRKCDDKYTQLEFAEDPSTLKACVVDHPDVDSNETLDCEALRTDDRDEICVKDTCTTRHAKECAQEFPPTVRLCKCPASGQESDSSAEDIGNRTDYPIDDDDDGNYPVDDGLQFELEPF